MLLYTMIASLIQLTLHLVQILNCGKTLPLHNRTPSMLYGWCDTGGCCSFTNSSLHINPRNWPNEFELWFVSPKDFISLPVVESLCTLAHWSLLTLFCFINSGFLTAILLYKPASQSLLLSVDTDSFFSCPVSWGCRIPWLLCRGVRTPFSERPWYDTKQYDGEVPVMLELCRMWITSSLSLLPDPFWHSVVAPDSVLSMSQIELNCVLMLNWIVWNRTLLTFNYE